MRADDFSLLGAKRIPTYVLANESRLFVHRCDKLGITFLICNYPKHVINRALTKKIQQFHKLPRFSPKKYSVFLLLPWLENILTRIETQIKTAVRRCFFAVEPFILFTTRQLLSTTNKNVLPASYHAIVV